MAFEDFITTTTTTTTTIVDKTNTDRKINSLCYFAESLYASELETSYDEDLHLLLISLGISLFLLLFSLGSLTIFFCSVLNSGAAALLAGVVYLGVLEGELSAAHLALFAVFASSTSSIVISLLWTSWLQICPPPVSSPNPPVISSPQNASSNLNTQHSQSSPRNPSPSHPQQDNTANAAGGSAASAASAVTPASSSENWRRWYSYALGLTAAPFCSVAVSFLFLSFSAVRILRLFAVFSLILFAAIFIFAAVFLPSILSIFQRIFPASGDALLTFASSVWRRKRRRGGGGEGGMDGRQP